MVLCNWMGRKSLQYSYSDGYKSFPNILNINVMDLGSSCGLTTRQPGHCLLTKLNSKQFADKYTYALNEANIKVPLLEESLLFSLYYPRLQRHPVVFSSWHNTTLPWIVGHRSVRCVMEDWASNLVGEFARNEKVRV